MTIPTPNLDDRDFDTLLEQARTLVSDRRGEWNELSPGDPGTILLEAFAYLTDVLLYRVNRVPEKAWREFLNLLNLEIGAPAAAEVSLLITQQDEAGDELELPAGLRVQADDPAGGEPVVFVTASPVVVPADGLGVSVVAHNCTQVSGALVGVSSGVAGQQFRLDPHPVVLPTGHELDLVVGVAATEDELEKRPHAREFNGQPYVVWDEVENFTGLTESSRAFMIDRASGVVSFAPALRQPVADGGVEQFPNALAAIPPAGREIRVWYRSGGGAVGNVAAGTITNVLDPTPEPVTVTNLHRAAGGRDAESIEQALARASSLYHEPRRAITSDDFEALACRNGGVSRARAITASDRWAHARPGTVDLHLVPTLPPEVESPSATDLADMSAPAALAMVSTLIESRQPLGIETTVDWAAYKRVSIQLRVVVSRSEDPVAVRTRVAERLRAALNPVPTDTHSGWPFGQALRASNVYDIALREPGVRYADSVRIEVDETPDQECRAIAADHHQPATWYVGQGSTLFRSENNGLGWEAIWKAPGATIERIVPAAERPGHVAVVVEGDDGKSSRLFISTDCCSTVSADPVVAFSWEDEADQAIHDACWLPSGVEDDLALATDQGLYRVRLGEAAPRPWTVDPANPGRGCWAVDVSAIEPGRPRVLVALKQRGGVWMSAGERFVEHGLAGIDIRRLVMERRGNRSFVWAPAFAAGDDPGTGCSRAEIVAAERGRLRWEPFDEGWNGGICHDLAFLDDVILAASEFNGIMTRPYGRPETPWRGPSVESGLPLQESSRRRFHRVAALAAFGPTAMAGTFSGLYRTEDGRSFDVGAVRRSPDIVTIPPSWLFASGDHVVDVMVEDR